MWISPEVCPNKNGKGKISTVNEERERGNERHRKARWNEWTRWVPLLHINGYTSLGRKGGCYHIGGTGENDEKETLTRRGCLLDTRTPLNVGWLKYLLWTLHSILECYLRCLHALKSSKPLSNPHKTLILTHFYCTMIKDINKYELIITN